MLHEAFAAFGSTVPGAAGSASSQHLGLAVLPTGPLEHVQPHELDSPLAVAMLAGHALSTLACALLLTKGEDAL